MISIDQNSHSLWDALPKCLSLARRGRAVRHFVEDVDVAFTALGSGAGELTLDRERYHHSGGAWWGAALFYSEFLGRLPVDVRGWAPYVGMTTAALARQLGRTVEDLYAEYSPSDNWQLIGPSYVGDDRHHRVIGDLAVSETAPFLRQIMDLAGEDMRRAFPDAACRRRAARWLGTERERLEGLLADHAGGTLPELYRDWMGRGLGGGASVGAAGRLFACDGPPAGTAALEAFCRDYDTAAGLYNRAVEETGAEMRPLDTDAGELPFFAVLEREGHRVRTGASLAGETLAIGERTFTLAAGGRLPLADLAAAGVRCLTGKAAVLVIQVRLGESGEALALPYRGSGYMPTAHRLARLLAGAGLLDGPLRPVVRVRFRLLDRLRSLAAPIRLPGHLAAAMGEEVVPARRLGEAWADLAEGARRRLESFREPAGRRRWRERALPGPAGELARLNGARRERAAAGAGYDELHAMWERAKALRRELLVATVRQVARDWQVSRIDYWDSRGAILPWTFALGGEDFTREVIDGAEVYEEPSA